MWLNHIKSNMIKEALSAQYHLRNQPPIPKQRQAIFNAIKQSGESITLFHTSPRLPFPIEKLDSALQNQDDPRKLMMLSTQLLGTSANEGRGTAHQQVFFSTNPDFKDWLADDERAVQMVFEVPLFNLLETQILIFGQPFEQWLIEKYDYNNEEFNQMDELKEQRRMISKTKTINFEQDLNGIIKDLKIILNEIGQTELTSLNILPMRYLVGIRNINNDFIYINPKREEQARQIELSDYLNKVILGRHKESVKFALQAGAKPSYDTLYYAISTNDIEIVQMVLDAGAQVENNTFNLALHTRDKEIIQLIINAGAKPNSQSLYIAIGLGDKEIIKFILQLGIKPNSNELNRAITLRYKEIIELFLQLGIKPDNYSLHDAIETNDEEIVQMVLNAGAIPNSSVCYSPNPAVKSLVKQYYEKYTSENN